MTIIENCETSIRGDAPANHAGGVGSIPASRSDYQNFNDLDVREVQSDIARDVIISNHYSKKWNAAFGRHNFGIFRNHELLGVAVYGHPMNPGSWPSITDTSPESCIELNRLWVNDSLIKNTETWFIKKSSDLLRAKGFSLIQSFADGRLGVGTIYQASNFGYYGYHTSTFHEDLVSGEVFHDVPFANTARPETMLNRNLLHVLNRLKTFEVKTYRYLLPLTKHAARRIKLEKKPYPKVRDGVAVLENYEVPVGQIIRSAAIAKQLFRESDLQRLEKYLDGRVANVQQEIELARQSEYICSIRADMPLFEL